MLFMIGLFLPVKEKKINIDYPKLKSNEISLITLNTWGLPIWYGQSTNEKRYDDLIRALNQSEANIICLQETFHPKLRAMIKEKLDKDYQSLTDYSRNRKVCKLIKMDCNGGLITLTKYPIEQEEFFAFPQNDKYSLIEKIGRKGFLFTTLNIDGSMVNIINTHLYSGSEDVAESQRSIQIMYMDSILHTIEAYKAYPTMLSGDLNIQHPYSSKYNKEKDSKVYKQIDSLRWFDTKLNLTDADFTFDPKGNKYVSKTDKRQILDYIMWNDECCSFNLVKDEVVFNGVHSVSDHNGFRILFNLNRNKQPSFNKLLANSN